MSALTDITGSRILVTGGTGLIGRATVTLLRDLGAEVTAFDLRETPGLADIRFLKGDITDAATVRTALHHVDAVVHLGGIPGLGVVDAVQTYRINTVGTFVVLTEAADAGLGKAVYASSINANGYPLNPQPVLPPRLPYDESLEPAIGDWYSLSKLANEDAARMVSARWNLPLTGLRFPLVRDIRADGGRVFGEHLRRAMTADPRRQACEGWSYLDVTDAARAVVAALTHETPPAPGILVAAPNTYLSTATSEAIDIHAPAAAHGGPGGEDSLPGRSVALDLSAARDLLHFEARVLLEEVAPDQLIDLSDLPGSNEKAWSTT